MTTLYIYGSAAVFMGLVVWYVVRLIKANVKLRQEVEDAKQYSEAMQEAAQVKRDVRSAGKSVAGDRMRKRVRNR